MDDYNDILDPEPVQENIEQTREQMIYDAQREALLTTAEIQQAADKAQHYLHEKKALEACRNFLQQNPDLREYTDLVSLEIKSTPWNAIDDPYFERRVAIAGQKVREKLARVKAPLNVSVQNFQEIPSSYKDGTTHKKNESYAKMLHERRERIKSPYSTGAPVGEEITIRGGG